MEWLAKNWFWVVVFIAFFAMHLFGHGGHGGGGGCGGGHGGRRPSDKDENRPQTPAGHQH
ncbi:MAG: DUF2933 domain-containing protein [Pseudomonadota bacterium]